MAVEEEKIENSKIVKQEDIIKNKKENFTNTKNEWHELKKDKEKFKITINEAKIWFLNTLKIPE